MTDRPGTFKVASMTLTPDMLYTQGGALLGAAFGVLLARRGYLR